MLAFSAAQPTSEPEQQGDASPRSGGSAAMYRFSAICVIAVVLGALAAGPVSAQGFGVYEQGACMMGRGGAGVADPCPDGSGAFFNPAGLSFEAKLVTLGGALIGPQGTFCLLYTS